MKNQFQNLTETQGNDLPKLLQKIEYFFDGTLGTWKTYPVYFILKYNTKPIRSRLYPLPKVHEEMLKKEVESLVLLGFLERENYSEWGDPSFTQPKPKKNQLSFLSDFRNLNEN